MKNTLTAKKIAEICHGIVFCGDGSVECTNFNKDTRTIKPNETYIGLKGLKFDGNLFYREAFSKGATCAILEKSSFDKNYDGDKTIILVDDSIEALRLLGKYKRETSDAVFVGVTGSVGKTSTRDMVYSVLKEEYKTLKTEGNYNNNVGLPLTLLRLKDESAAVIEMGMNSLGEIDYLSKIARPNIGIITNVGTAHIGELGSRENILKAKLEILNGMDERSKLIINNDNDLLHEYYLKNKKNIVTVGIDNESDFTAKNIVVGENRVDFDIIHGDSKYPSSCPIPNKVFVYNSLIAFAVGTLLNLNVENIIRGIENFELTKNRSQIHKTANGITIIDDVYNANVDSMKSGLDLLENLPSKRKIACLGSMLELGKFSKSLHTEVGRYAVKKKVDILVTVGEEAKYIATSAIEAGMNKDNVFSFEDNKSAIEKLKTILKLGDAVLLKASNSLHFKEIVEELKKEN